MFLVLFFKQLFIILKQKSFFLGPGRSRGGLLLERGPTGIEGLDELLEGGLPKEKIISKEEKLI